ncbi:hypothetical protein Sjap_015971 [Stephania japonica]|uniref:Ribosomal RNA small subunit methyltransferase G n=1 Tax=Stephania japonica TaxID=461633 RepID=A0AAP0NT15_9MAGN
MSISYFNSPHVLHRFTSLRTFIKHLVSPKTAVSPTTPHRRTSPTLRTLCSSNLEALTSRQREQISLYVDALLQWNRKMNLTAVTETSEVMKRHVEDSLAILPPIRSSYVSGSGSSGCDDLSVVDVGSGPGLPGLILAIACPGWKVTLLESMKKRCDFLEHAIGITGLSNVEVLRGRAEKSVCIGQSVGQSLDSREMFDVAVARAVAEMRILAEYCLPLVRVGGLFVAAKGHDIEEEVKNANKAIRLLGASTLHVSAVQSHSPYGQRTAIVCRKDRPTPRKYPREPGTPAKVPL